MFHQDIDADVKKRLGRFSQRHFNQTQSSKFSKFKGSCCACNKSPSVETSLASHQNRDNKLKDEKQRKGIETAEKLQQARKSAG